MPRVRNPIPPSSSLERLRPETRPEVPHLLGEAGPSVFPHFHDQHPAAGSKHAVHLREHRLQIHDVVQDQREDRQIEHAGIDGQRGKVSLNHLRGRLVPQSAARHTEHGRRAVQRNDPAGEGSEEPGEMAGAASEIADGLGAAKQPGEEGGIHPGAEELLAQPIPAARLRAEERPRARRPGVQNAPRPPAVLLYPGLRRQAGSGPRPRGPERRQPGAREIR